MGPRVSRKKANRDEVIDIKMKATTERMMVTAWLLMQVL